MPSNLFHQNALGHFNDNNDITIWTSDIWYPFLYREAEIPSVNYSRIVKIGEPLLI